MTDSPLRNWAPIDATQNNPFVGQAFLQALETTDVVRDDGGWQAKQLNIDNRIWIPSYSKTHSWGEYVFDWAWAQAYEQYGLAYYPKLVVAAPYTPSMGPRLLGAKTESDVQTVIATLKETCLNENYSGFHILFPSNEEQALLNTQPLLKRTDVQFHWQNRDYTTFDDFLERFSSRKRKNVRKERQSIGEQGIAMRTIEGPDISTREMDAFYQFYHATYLKRGRHGYLNRAFFEELLQTMASQLVLVMAEVDENPIASALFFKDDHSLYGRYWGCFHDYKNLHFEACYYQGIDYCIRNGLKRFDPGTQGEHKIARGFEPTFTHSYHWLADERFHAAVERFCNDEARMTQQYFEDTTQALPFKSE